MATYKDGKVWRYRCTITLPDGTTERISGTPSAANTKLAAQQAEEAHRLRAVNGSGAPAAVPKASPPFTTFAEEWLAAYPSAAENRPSTITEKNFHVRFHLIPYFGDKPLDQIDTRAITTMISDLKKKPKMNAPAETLSPKTVKNIAQTLHKMLATAKSWKLITEFPEFPTRKTAEAPWDWYTAEEMAALFAVIPSDEIEHVALLMFALRTGARCGEQLGVAWGDVDFKNRQVHFSHQVHKGKLGPLKAGPARRAVDLSPQLVEVLKRHKARQVRSLDTLRPAGSDLGRDTQGASRRDYVFPREDGTSMSPKRLWWVLQKYARRAGLRVLRWHDLRHSFASQAVSAGVPLKQVQVWLGHTTINMTMRYAHLSPAKGAEYVRMLDVLDAGVGGSV